MNWVSDMQANKGGMRATMKETVPPGRRRWLHTILLGMTPIPAITSTPASAQVATPFIGIAPRNAPATTTTAQSGIDQFSVTPSISTVYDSNMLRLNDIRAPGTQLDDVRVTPAVAVALRQGFARNTVSLSGSIGYDFYRRFKQLDRLRGVVNAAAVLPLDAYCGLAPQASLEVRQAELEDLGVTVGRTQQTLTGALTARCTRSAGFFPIARIDVLRLTNTRNRSVFNDEEVPDDTIGIRPANALNRTNWSASGGLVYAKPSLGQIQLFGNTARFRRQGRTGGPDTGADVVGGGIQFERSLTSRFATRASVAAVHVESNRALSRSFDTVTYNVDIRIAPIPSMILSPMVSRQVVANINAGVDYVLAREVGIGMDWSVGSRTGIVAQLSEVRRRYYGEEPVILNQFRIADVTDSASAGVRYRVRSLNLLGRVTYLDRNSRNNFYSFSSTRVEFSARAGF